MPAPTAISIIRLGQAPSSQDSLWEFPPAADNTNSSLLDITLGTVGTFRLGVIQNGAGAEINSFTLESGATSATVNVDKTTSDDGQFLYSFFDVTAAQGTTLTLEINGSEV